MPARSEESASAGQYPYLYWGKYPMYMPTVFGHDFLQEKATTLRRRNGMKTIGTLLGNEGINAAMVVVLSGTIMVLVAKGGRRPRTA